MITLRTLSLADALAVTENMREMDRHCLEVVTGATNSEAFALNRWQTNGAAWSVLDGETPIAIAGISQAVPWIGVVWIVATDGMTPASWKKLLRHGRIVLGNASKQIRRIEAHVLATWTQAQDLAARNGFELEGVRHGAGRDGQDVLTYLYRGKQ